MGAVVWADEAPTVAWHTQLDSAWAQSCQQGRPLLVFVTCENCRFCDRMKQGTFARADMAEAINRSFVPLTLDGSVDTPLVKELNVKYYPVTFIISPQAVILARIDGYVSPEQLAARLASMPSTAATSNVAQGK
jgi:protein disulfide-isomerase